MIDFNQMLNASINDAIKKAIDEATTGYIGAIKHLAFRIEELEKRIDDRMIDRQEVSDIAQDAAQKYMETNSKIDNILGTDDFASAVREVIRDAL